MQVILESHHWRKYIAINGSWLQFLRLQMYHKRIIPCNSLDVQWKSALFNRYLDQKTARWKFQLSAPLFNQSQDSSAIKLQRCSPILWNMSRRLKFLLRWTVVPLNNGVTERKQMSLASMYTIQMWLSNKYQYPNWIIHCRPYLLTHFRL